MLPYAFKCIEFVQEKEPYLVHKFTAHLSTSDKNAAFIGQVRGVVSMGQPT